MSVQLFTSIDEDTKQKFDKICEAIGVSPSNAISMLIREVINYNGIPFNAAMPPQAHAKMTMADAMGCMRGQFTMSDDFDAPLEDFREYME